MSVFATIVVANKNKSAAQDLTSSEMFTSEFKKGIRKYWVSSGYFPDDYYNALINSDLIFAIDTQLKPTSVLTDLGMMKVTEE